MYTEYQWEQGKITEEEGREEKDPIRGQDLKTRETQKRRNREGSGGGDFSCTWRGQSGLR